MAFPGTPDNVRYEMNNQNRFFLCRHCRNHIVPLYNCAFYIGGPVSGYICYNAVNVRTDPLPSYWHLYDRPVLNVRCNDCNRHIGEKFFATYGDYLLHPDELLYWDGTRLHNAPYENGGA